MKKLTQNMLFIYLSTIFLHNAYASRALQAEEKQLLSNSRGIHTMEEQLELGKLSFNKGDYKQAHIHLDEAANLGSGKAAYNLGLIYEIGYDGPKNPQQAVHWYTQAKLLGYSSPNLEKNLPRAIKSMANNLPASEETKAPKVEINDSKVNINQQRANFLESKKMMLQYHMVIKILSQIQQMIMN